MKKIGTVSFAVFGFLLLIAVIAIPRLDVLKTAKITADEDYKRYEELKNEGEFDNNNLNMSESDKIRVSLGENKLMDVEYYYDDAMLNKVEKAAYLLPGDTIYIKRIKDKSSGNELYVFSRYEVYEIINKSSKERIVKLKEPETHYTIPENFKGKEIQILPYGEYKKGTVKLNAYCNSGDALKEAVITGKWEKDNTEIKGDIVEIGPSETYTLFYNFNKDEYFLYKTSPESFSQEDGKVTFVKADSSDADNPQEYTVELMRYLQLSFEFNKKAKIFHNDILLKENTKSYKIQPEEKLKLGDIIRIETAGEIKICDGDYQYLRITRERSETNQLYTYLIEINENNRKDNASDTATEGVTIIKNVNVALPGSNEFGKAVYEINSEEIEDGYKFKEGDKLKIKFSLSDDGYVFSDRNAIDRFFDVKTKTVDVLITEEMDGTAIDLSEYFKVEKGEK